MSDSLTSLGKKHAIYRYLFWAGIVIVTVFSLIPRDINEMIGVNIWDKLEHFSTYCILLILGRLAYPDKKNLVKTVAGLFLLGCSLEILQIYIPNRQAGIDDAAANTLGIIAGTVIEYFIRKIRSAQQD